MPLMFVLFSHITYPYVCQALFTHKETPLAFRLGGRTGPLGYPMRTDLQGLSYLTKGNALEETASREASTVEDGEQLFSVLVDADNLHILF